MSVGGHWSEPRSRSAFPPTVAPILAAILVGYGLGAYEGPFLDRAIRVLTGDVSRNLYLFAAWVLLIALTTRGLAALAHVMGHVIAALLTSHRVEAVVSGALALWVKRSGWYLGVHTDQRTFLNGYVIAHPTRLRNLRWRSMVLWSGGIAAEFALLATTAVAVWFKRDTLFAAGFGSSTGIAALTASITIAGGAILSLRSLEATGVGMPSDTWQLARLWRSDPRTLGELIGFATWRAHVNESPAVRLDLTAEQARLALDHAGRNAGFVAALALRLAGETRNCSLAEAVLSHPSLKEVIVKDEWGLEVLVHSAAVKALVLGATEEALGEITACRGRIAGRSEELVDSHVVPLITACVSHTDGGDPSSALETWRKWADSSGDADELIRDHYRWIFEALEKPAGSE